MSDNQFRKMNPQDLDAFYKIGKPGPFEKVHIIKALTKDDFGDFGMDACIILICIYHYDFHRPSTLLINSVLIKQFVDKSFGGTH